MFNVKWAVFPAGAAFLLAFVTSLLMGQVGFAAALLRAFVFAALFFGIGCGAWVLINTYIPELLFLEDKNAAGDGVFPTELPAEGGSPDPSLGTNVNITLEDAALPGDSYGIDGIGNIADLVAKVPDPAEKPKDIDQAPANSYNLESGDLDFAPASATSEKPGFSPAENSGLGDFASFFDGLTSTSAAGDADDSLADLFQTMSSGNKSAGSEEIPGRDRKTMENKPAEVAGDFSAKEIAVGIRTVLAKEKRG